MRRQAFVLTLGILLAFVPPAGRAVLAGPATAYTVTDLGTIDSLVPTITGINASGQISGYISTGAGLRAVRYTGGAWQHVPGLETTYSAATAINAQGDLAGYEFTSVGIRAFRYVDGVGVTPFGLLPGGSMTIGTGINDNGDVVGWGDSTSGTRGWRAAGGSTSLTILPTLPGGGAAMACGINNSGAIVGSSSTSTGAQDAYRINADGTTDDAGTFDGIAGSSSACPGGIDDNGRIGGNSSKAGSTHAFRFDTGALVDIDAFGSTFSAVQAVSAGVSVGLYATATGDNHAFVQNGTDTSVDLNTVLTGADGWVLSEALAVNNKGAIAGDGLLNGVQADFLLTPVQGDTTPPTIASISASPSTITPPNGAMVNVSVSVHATDDVDPSPTCSIDKIAASGSTAANSSVTGALTGSVAATGGTTYTFNVTCADASGNQAHSSVDVVVPPDTTAPVISSVSANPSSISPVNGAMVPVTIVITATDDSGVAPACSLASISGPGTSGVDYGVTGQYTGTVKAIGGRTYTFTAHCLDGSGNASQSSTDVVVPADKTAPAISNVAATPSTIWPPLGQTVPVTITVNATDDSGIVACSLASISGPGSSGVDYQVTGMLSGTVKAIGGRTYSFSAVCTDYSGNASSASANVVVPPDTTAPVITSVSATPSAIWPPDNKMVNVSVSVTATDDVDPSPVCSLTAISGSAANAAITGAFSASVRASNGAAYVLTVTCSDASGNRSAATVSVAVTKDPASLLKSNGKGSFEAAFDRSKDDDRDKDQGKNGRSGQKNDDRRDDRDGRGDHRG